MLCQSKCTISPIFRSQHGSTYNLGLLPSFGEETVKPKEKNMSRELQVHRGVDENKPRRQSWVCKSHRMGEDSQDYVLGVLSRPCGTGPRVKSYPGLASWATLSRPYGTVLIHPDSRLVFSECCLNQPIEKSKFGQV